MRYYRRALITGATSGIGKAFASELPVATDLLIAGRNPEALAQVQAKLGQGGRRVETIAADLATTEGCERVIAAARTFGPDLLINNAGVGFFGPAMEIPAENEINTVMVNVVAVVSLTRALVPEMIDRASANGRRAGVIVVASTAALAPIPYLATYAASKAFDLHYTEALAEELRDAPIDVLALCPGATRTAFGKRAGAAISNIPGASDPRDVARSALQAIGCGSVHLSGRLDQLALGPAVLPRGLLTRALGGAMRLFAPSVRR